jgi:hypothetical protein
MRGRPAALFVLAVGCVLAASGVAFSASPALLERAQTAATKPTVDDAKSSTVVSAPASLVAAAPAPEPVAPAAVAEPAPVPKAAPAAMAFPEMKHVWQSLNNCGPAAVVMALSTLGVDVSQEHARVPLRGTNIASGMGPQRVDGWVNAEFGLRSVWRNNGTNDLMRRLVANGFAPMVTQWMQDPWVSRVAHWRTIRGYNDTLGTFYVNDSMLGRMIPLGYQWFQENWQPFSYRYMVIYRPEDQALLKTIIGDDWDNAKMRKNFYDRAKADAAAQNTMAAWITYGQASYEYGKFEESVAAFQKGIAMGSVQGIFTIRGSYPQALRALGRQTEADEAARRLSTNANSSTVASPPDPFALYLAYLREQETEANKIAP